MTECQETKPVSKPDLIGISYLTEFKSEQLAAAKPMTKIAETCMKTVRRIIDKDTKSSDIGALK